MNPDNLTVAFLSVALLLVIFVFYKLVTWARTRSTGAVVAGAVMVGMMAPDPLLEEQLKVLHEEQQKRPEDDESGAGRN
jgi:hypothetical protein